jgi:hypothetical protein
MGDQQPGGSFRVRPPAAIEACRDGLALARRVGDRTALFNMRSLLGWAQQVSGDLDGALASFEAGLADEPEPPDALVLLDGVIIAKAARGEPVAGLLAELERLAVGMSDWNVIWTTVDAPAWAAFCEGRLDEAGRRWREGAARSPAQAAGWLPPAAGVAMIRGQADVAAADLAALDATGFHTPYLELQRRRVRAGLTALDGRRSEAARAYRDVLQEMLDRGYAWDHALAAVEMAKLVGPSEPEAIAAAAVARSTLERTRQTLPGASRRRPGAPGRRTAATRRPAGGGSGGCGSGGGDRRFGPRLLIDPEDPVAAEARQKGGRPADFGLQGEVLVQATEHDSRRGFGDGTPPSGIVGDDDPDPRDHGRGNDEGVRRPKAVSARAGGLRAVV